MGGPICWFTPQLPAPTRSPHGSRDPATEPSLLPPRVCISGKMELGMKPGAVMWDLGAECRLPCGARVLLGPSLSNQGSQDIFYAAPGSSVSSSVEWLPCRVWKSHELMRRGGWPG